MIEVLTGFYGVKWKAVIKSEYDSLIQNGIWKFVSLSSGRKAVICKWVFKIKFNSDGFTVRYKVRLLVRGFI